MNLAVSGGFGVNAIPWFKQIQKVFVRGLAGHNGRNSEKGGLYFLV
jgi:hypothetical protein